MKTAREIANWFILKNRIEAGDCRENYLTPMALQKLLYFAQGYYLGCYNRPLFRDSIEAWKHGPVVRSVYNAYSQFGGCGIDIVPDCNESDFSPHELRALNAVYDRFAQYSGIKLSQITHEPGSPWDTTARNGVIVLEKMRDYFEDCMISEEEEKELLDLERSVKDKQPILYSRELYQ